MKTDFIFINRRDIRRDYSSVMTVTTQTVVSNCLKCIFASNTEVKNSNAISVILLATTKVI